MGLIKRGRVFCCCCLVLFFKNKILKCLFLLWGHSLIPVFFFPYVVSLFSVSSGIISPVQVSVQYSSVQSLSCV